MDVQKKWCFQCGGEKELGEFRLDSRSRDGRRNRCSACYRLPALSREQRFWLLVDRRGPDECWPWLGWRVEFGHGQVKLARRTQYAHRVAWSLVNGPVPGGEQVLHSCDNPPCCNPRHLFLGSQLDNVRDMVAKGRRADTRGEADGMAKLTEGEVHAIRCAAARGVRFARLAGRYGVSEKTIDDITSRKTWRHVE